MGKVYKTQPAEAMDTAQGDNKQDKQEKDSVDMSNVLTHIKTLETTKQELEKQLREEKSRSEKFSQKTREGMQSALDTLMKKWMDAVETKDTQVKDHFKSGLDALVSKSAEDNGVWQMMVAASSLHERQEHDLEKIRCENSDLRAKVDGLYAEPHSRVVGDKHKATNELSRVDVEDSGADNMWNDFAKHIGTVY